MIVLHAAGNEKIGIGHLKRCHTLAKWLKKFCSEEVCLLLECEKSLADFFSSEDITIITAKNRNEAIKYRRELFSNGGVLITDLLGLDELDKVEAQNEGVRWVVHLNDNGIESYKPDLIVDGDFDAAKKYSGKKLDVLAGPAYFIINDNITQLRPKVVEGNGIRKVLVTFGGADPGNYTEFFADKLVGVTTKEFTFIMGPAFSTKRKEYLKSFMHNKHYIFIDSPSDMGRLLLEHDLIVSLGGITSYEAMCLGKLVATVEWQTMKKYVKILQEAEVVFNLGDKCESISRLIKVMNTPLEELRRISRNGWLSVDGAGAQRVAEYLVKLINSSGERQI
ncbi:hypothetical protein ACE3MQ_12290 [Paenibacillus lentus]|uniref:hypothetical protein n=1 Tax=Paenibacillus lentus TaxID=1338368 RepID=UPI00364ABD07